MLRCLGINLNLAPVVDLDLVDAENSLRGRLWGGDPEIVSGHTTAYLDGLQSGGVLGCLKHFPGLGREPVDSHKELPVITAGLEELMSVDLVPFARLAPIAPAVMVTHCSYPAIDESGTPASLAPAVYRILRDRIGFNGLAITDDLEMGALDAIGGWETKLAAALNAGADLLPICFHREVISDSFAILSRIASNGIVPAARLEEAIGRVLRIKEKIPRSDR